MSPTPGADRQTGEGEDLTLSAKADPADATPGSKPKPKPKPKAKPEQTRDDTDRGWGERPDEDAHDRWLREQRPPHWE
ncbi:hypothetical protein [Janibacter limosus]|uniref:Uncharacterized protein n=1 Tax=Janibacter limosus TaxID=53458 RepID=A0A4P6MYX3_9MICO|nr:hypothetical protein [Janibacter limosus]QBF47070.1 hypothetical protein EXU32_12920 [Janibacter limosus]